MRRFTSSFLLPGLAVCLMLTACNSGGSHGVSIVPGGAGNSTTIDNGGMPPTQPVKRTREGRIYRKALKVAATGDTLVFQVFEPNQLTVGQTYPLIIQGHGYGGSRETDAPKGSFIARLRNAGFYVISVDQRGFGQSSGQVRVMDPEYEGKDLIAMLNWAENLPGLRRRANGKMMLGSYGGSYGGMYQMLLYAMDPQHRLRVMEPNITPYDLTYALDSHNVVKSLWGLALVAGGEANARLLAGLQNGKPVQSLVTTLVNGGTRQDPVILEMLLKAGLTNNFPEAGYDFMKYHSFAYFCNGKPITNAPGFLLGRQDQFNVPPKLPPPADVLLTQGFRDTLFNFNNAYNNYQCLKRIAKTNQDGNGFGDVRLLTHESGHILPVGLKTLGLEDPLDPLYGLVTFPSTGDPGGTNNCGSINWVDARFAWFQQKLNGVKGAIKKAIPSGHAVCESLGPGDAIAVQKVRVGGKSFDIDGSVPQLNSLLGVLGSLTGTAVRDDVLLADKPLYTVGDKGGIIAGIPTLDITMKGLTGLEENKCLVPDLPVQAACDPILFLAIGKRSKGQTRWDIIDDQVTPVRGFGEHKIRMNGIAERLQPGEQVALLVYAFSAQYPITWSRDVAVPAMDISGSVQLPILKPSDVAMTLDVAKP